MYGDKVLKCQRDKNKINNDNKPRDAPKNVRQAPSSEIFQMIWGWEGSMYFSFVQFTLLKRQIAVKHSQHCGQVSGYLVLAVAADAVHG